MACKGRTSVLGPRGDSGAVMVVSPSALAPAVDETELEPNDDLKTATPVSLVEQPVVLGGTLSVTAGRVDRDRYALKLPPLENGDAMGPSRRLRVELLVLPTPGVALLPMSLMVSQGHNATVSGGTTVPLEGEPVSSVLFPNIGADAERVDLTVAFRGKVDPATDRQVAYRLRIELGTVDAGVEREPNATLANATPMVTESLTMEMSGWLGWAGDIDCFVLPKAVLSGAPAVDIEVELPGDVQASVAVLGSDGALLGSVPPVQRRLLLKGAAVGAGDTLMVQIKATRRFSATEPYVLRVRPASAVMVPEDGGR